MATPQTYQKTVLPFSVAETPRNYIGLSKLFEAAVVNRQFCQLLLNQPETALQGLKIVVTHIKPTLNRDDAPERTIMNELSELNDLGVEFILPESGKRLVF